MKAFLVAFILLPVSLVADDYNPTILDGELKAAGLQIHGCDSNGIVSWRQSPTANDLVTAEQVKAQHNKAAADRLVEESKVDIDERITALEEQMKVLTNGR